MNQVVFFDFDDTLSDVVPFATAYSRAIGTELAGRFGGDFADWSHAAADMLRSVECDYITRFVGSPLNGYLAWLDRLRETAVEKIFASIGRPCPPESVGLYRDIQFNALSMCDATFHGAKKALQSLHRSGYRLMIASGQESEFLLGALTGAGLDGFFECLYGPDLIDCAKEGPEYHARVFDAVGIAPENAIVVDDYPMPIQWAVESGATVIQAQLSTSSRHTRMPGVAGVLTDMYDLPGLVKQLTP